MGTNDIKNNIRLVAEKISKARFITGFTGTIPPFVNIVA
jgi:hypothetical protein